MYCGSKLLLQIADAGGVQYVNWKLDDGVRTRERGLLSGCERMSKGVRTVRRRILIRRWAIVLKIRRERSLMGGLECATRERWVYNMVRSHGNIHPSAQLKW
jgi:hypothetical protein